MSETGPSAGPPIMPGPIAVFERRRGHLPWILVHAVVVALAIGWRWEMSRSQFEDGGQWWLGVVALGLLAASCAFVVRKRLYGSALGKLRHYYLVHVWAGLGWIVVAGVHADGQVRGPLYQGLAGCALATVATGLVVAGVQNRLVGRLRGMANAAGLLDDLVLARDRLQSEIDGLVAGQPPLLQQVAREVAHPGRAARWWTGATPGPDGERLARARAYIAGAALRSEAATELLRLAEDATELEQVQVQLQMQRGRARWLRLHGAIAAALVVLVAVHVIAVVVY